MQLGPTWSMLLLSASEVQPHSKRIKAAMLRLALMPFRLRSSLAESVYVEILELLNT